VIDGCVFYACTSDSGKGKCTANFGTGCISPWSASGWNVPAGAGVTMQAPLSYDPAYPYAEFSYASASDIHGSGDTPKVAGGSYLTLYKSLPSGYRLAKHGVDVADSAVAVHRNGQDRMAGDRDFANRDG
jgi:hypothetical protein